MLESSTRLSETLLSVSPGKDLSSMTQKTIFLDALECYRILIEEYQSGLGKESSLAVCFYVVMRSVLFGCTDDRGRVFATSCMIKNLTEQDQKSGLQASDGRDLHSSSLLRRTKIMQGFPNIL
jgi:hypothetical protein